MEVPGRIKPNTNYGNRKIFCQPCKDDGDIIQADGFCETCNEYFCSSCLKFHRKQSATKNHVIKGKYDMPRVQVQTDSFSELCEVHKTEVVKFFCEGHDSVGCGDCMVLEHKTCKVKQVSNVSRYYRNSYDLFKIKENIEKLEKRIKASNIEIKESLKAADEIKAEVIKEIQTFRRDMDTYLDKVEAELIKEVEQINVKDVTQQRQLFDECVTVENELQEVRAKLAQYSNKINQLFVTAKQAKTKLSQCRRNVEKIATESQIHVYNFKPCETMEIAKNNNTPIGKITTKIQKFMDMVNIKTHYEKTIHVKSSDESKECLITGLSMLSGDEILLADYNNKSLKIFSIRSNAITSILTLSIQPWDITVINSETAATTLPGHGKIVFISTRTGLSESHSLQVRMCCRGIDHRNGVIAVSYTSSPPAVQILNLKGDILHEVEDTSRFKCPYYIAFRDDTNIVMSDYGNNAVCTLTLDGQLREEMLYSPFKYPRGLAVTSNGTVIFFCEDNRDSVSMIEPETGTKTQLSVQLAHNPSTIIVCKDDSMMYICENSGSAEDSFVKVYTLLPLQ